MRTHIQQTKNIIAATMMLLTTSIAANAQSDKPMRKIELGARIMPTFTDFSVKTYTGGTIVSQGTFGYGFGGLLAMHFNKNFAVQGEVIYNSLAQKYKENNLERKINLRYVNIPILLSFNSDKTAKINFNVVAGPQIGISAGSSLFTSGTDTTVTGNALLAVRKGDLGLAYGAGIGYGLNKSNTVRLSIGFRGVYGLLDISNDSQSTNNNNYYILDKTHVKAYAGYLGISILL